MNTKTILCILVLMTTFCSSALAQTTTSREFETWGAIDLRYKINKKWKIGLQEQYRYSNTSAVTNSYFTELSADYKITNSLVTGIAFRYIRKNDIVGKIQGFEDHVRFQFDLGYRHTFNRFGLISRLRFQTRNELGKTQEEGDYLNNHLRLKLGGNYNIRKWPLDPVFAAEIFRHYEKESENGFDKMRYTFGTKYKTNSFGSIGVYYRLEKELNETEPVTTDIIAIRYSYTFKSKKKNN